MGPSKTVNINTAIYDKTVDRAAMIRLYEMSVAKKVNTVIDGHEVRVSDIIRQNKARLSDKLREEIDIELRSTFGNMHNVTAKSLLDLVNDQVSYTFQSLDNAIGKVWRTAKPNRRIAEEIVLQKPLYSDLTLAQGWSGISNGEKIRLEQVIRKGIADGLDEREIALTIRKGNVFHITRQNSLGLVRTAMTSVYAQADHEVYKANAKILKGWQYVAVLDTRTTPLCAHRDGTVYPVGDTIHLPPAHFHCRSTTTPIVKSYDSLLSSESIAQIRKRNLEDLSPKQIAMYDDAGPLKESYHDWLYRQPRDVQLKHLGDTKRLELFQSNQLSLDKFTDEGRAIGIRGLRAMTDSGYTLPNDTKKFSMAVDRLDSIKLGVTRPEELFESKEFTKNLEEYYKLQAGDLNGNLSYTNYRGTLLHTKKAMRNKVLSSPPAEQSLRFNPLTNRYDDSRLYQPMPEILQNNLRLMNESDVLKPADKEFINRFLDGLESKMSVNERAVIADNLRIVFSRFRQNKEPWANFKAVLNSQMKFDVMNVSDYMETQLRRNANVLQRLKQMEFVDAVLGPQSLQEIHDSFIDNIFKMRTWEYRNVPKIGRELRQILDVSIPPKLWVRLDEPDLVEFYQKFAKRLAMADTPDRDQLAIALGRDLYNAANYRGSRNEWFNLGVKILDNAKDKGFYELDTYGVQKRRMKSRNGNRYFGPYYDTFSVNVRITDPRILEYAVLTRKVDVGMRVGVTTQKNRLKIREGFKTYFTQDNRDTGIPIISADSFKDFPTEFIDKDMTQALNWAAQSEFRVDKDYFEFAEKLINFRDDKGRAEYYNSLNQYKEYLTERGDTYERFMAMKWLKDKDASFSNHPFLDHRGRIYERGFIGPQAGETFRPFLNTREAKNFSVEEYYNLQDQVGSFIGGLSDKLEGNFNSLSVTGRQGIANKWRPEMIKLGQHMLRGKPNDMRAILESPLLAEIDGEDQGKAMRLFMELAKIDEFLKSPLKGKYVEGGTITHDGILYDADAIFAISENKGISKFKVKDLDWVLRYDIPNAKRVIEADLEVPIIVSKSRSGKLTVIDGLHRLKRATDQGLDTLPGKFIDPLELRRALPIEDAYSDTNLVKLKNYKISLALEQDASSSGAQIIALTTRNKELAKLSNVVPTNQKQRLYDEIAASTFNDPRFRELNKKLGLTEKDLRKAAKSQNMVECCHV